MGRSEYRMVNQRRHPLMGRKLKRRLIESGGGSALQAEFCKDEHAACFRKSFKFCPHCGKEIRLVKQCGACGRIFTSAKSFRYHLAASHLRPHECPVCRMRSGLRQEVMRVRGDLKDTKVWHCHKCGARFQWYARSARARVLNFSREDLPTYP